MEGHSPLSRRRPSIRTHNTLRNAQRLVGSVDPDGFATLQPDAAVDDEDSDDGSERPSGQINIADTAQLKVLDSSPDDWSGELSEEEDYDAMKLDPDVVVEGSRGGGVADSTTVRGKMPGEAANDAAENARRTSFAEPVQTPVRATRRESGGGRRKSIQVTLESTGRKGKYILTADDPEIGDVLRHSIEDEMARAGAGGAKKPRNRFRDLVFTRQFTTFDRQNPTSYQSPFHGFFTLFWLAMALLLCRVAAQNWRTYGSVLGRNEIMHMMFDRDIVVLGLTDGVMTLSTAFGLLLQKLMAKNYLSWNRLGWIIQHVWQTFYLFSVLWWTWYREWPWTHTIFIVLHTMVFLMKQHSYAFYNGYLSQVLKRKTLLEQKLAQLETIEPLASPTSPESPTLPVQVSGIESPKRESLQYRRRSLNAKTSTNLTKEQSEIAEIASALESGRPLDANQLRVFEHVIRSEIKSLDEELHAKCTDPQHCYPRNLTVANFADWTCLPTVVYELEYPRQEHINWWYVAEKTAATFGVIWVMVVISQAYIYPSVTRAVQMQEAGLPLQERWNELPWILSDMLFPLLLEQLLAWYVIWECALNVLAELTRFADRGFYGDWWNSVSWDQYARDWNRPVHAFLLRHVYHSSISTFRLSKSTATFVTFLLSACVHELVMLCLFKKVRGYLFAMQLMQLPLAAMSRTKFLKGRNVLGNVVFWFGLFVGPSFITSLYLIV